MPMTLVGQYDSPYTRRVAVSLGLLGFEFVQDARSVFADFDSMLGTNPLGRVPSLILADGTTLIDSSAILDWLDQQVGPERALLPASGAARQETLQRIALATGTIDKIMGAAYERFVRPERYRWADWIARCRTQAEGGLRALAAESWSADAPVRQDWIKLFASTGEAFINSAAKMELPLQKEVAEFGKNVLANVEKTVENLTAQAKSATNTK